MRSLADDTHLYVRDFMEWLRNVNAGRLDPEGRRLLNREVLVLLSECDALLDELQGLDMDASTGGGRR